MPNKWNLINADSGEKTWLTPRPIIEALGHFDTDPCCPQNMPWRTADTMLTKAEDGTTAPWHGRVWLNPPYGRDGFPFLSRMAAYTGGGYSAYLRPHRRPPMARMGVSCRALCPLHSRPHPLLRRKRQARAVRTNALGARRLLCGGHPCAQAERHQRHSSSTERRKHMTTITFTFAANHPKTDTNNTNTNKEKATI